MYGEAIPVFKVLAFCVLTNAVAASGTFVFVALICTLLYPSKAALTSDIVTFNCQRRKEDCSINKQVTTKQTVE